MLSDPQPRAREHSAFVDPAPTITSRADLATYFASSRGMIMAVRRIPFVATFILLVVTNIAIASQGPVRGKLEPERDKVLEINSKHNLDVARWSISKRKAYKGGIDRLQEILDTHPDFSRMDEVLYWMGEAYVKLNEQEKAEPYYSKLLKAYPESEFVKKAKEQLDKIKPGTGKN